MAGDSIVSTLNACGLPLVNPGGRRYVDLAYSYVVTVSMPAAAPGVPVILFDQEIVIRETAEFWLRMIRTSQTGGRDLFWRWGLPGRWAMSDRARFRTSVGAGSFGKAMPQMRFTPGAKIIYEVESQELAPFDFQFTFDGVERYYL